MSMRNGERGQAMVVMALFVGIVMLGFLAFALDVGYFFREKRMAQAAADAAALAAAEEYGASDGANAQAVANAAATMNGFNTSLATNPATVNLSQPTAGNYSNSSGSTAPTNWVLARVSQPIHGLFLSAFKHASTTMTITAAAMASEGDVSSTCVCLESGSGEDLNMSNDAKLTTNNCGITVNSSSSNAVGVVGSATVSALTLGMISTSWNESSNVNNGGSITSGTKIVQGIAATCSPAMPTAPSDSTCAADPINGQQGGATYNVGPLSPYGTTENGDMVCYTSLSVGANGDTVTLNAGIYVINGGNLHFYSGGNHGGSGVFFYLENNATLTIDNGANIDVSAPTSGTYSGILFYQEASDTNAVSVQGGATAVINGAIYAPGAALTLGNGSGSSVTAEIVAQSLTMNGGGTLNSSPTIPLGGLASSAAKLTQ